MNRNRTAVAWCLAITMLLCFAGCHKNIPTDDGASSPSSATSSQEGGNLSSSGEQNGDGSVSSQETSEPEEATESLPDLQASPGGEEGKDRAISGDPSGGSSSGVSATVTYQTGGRGYYPAITNYEPSYQTLTEGQKVAYRCIATAVSYMRTTKFYFNTSNMNQQGLTLTRSDVLLAYSAVMNDHPEYFWMSKTYVTNKQDCVYMECSYNCTPAEKTQKQAQIRQRVSSFLSGLTDGMSDLALEKAVHDFVISGVSYGYGGASPSNVDSDAYNIYGALVGGSAVCEGYARAVQYLCTQVGLECVLQRGTEVDASGNMVDHMWNAVCINGNWYQMDATWDDPIYSDGVQRISYDYFNLTTQEIQSVPGRNRSFYAQAGAGNQSELSNFVLPSCISTAESYHTMAWAFIGPGESVGTKVNQAILNAQAMGIHEIEIFLDTSSGSTFSNSVYGCVDTTWIANTGISHLKCVGLENYLKISW
jgi:hypothetical protein